MLLPRLERPARFRKGRRTTGEPARERSAAGAEADSEGVITVAGSGPQVVAPAIPNAPPQYQLLAADRPRGIDNRVGAQTALPPVVRPFPHVAREIVDWIGVVVLSASRCAVLDRSPKRSGKPHFAGRIATLDLWAKL